MKKVNILSVLKALKINKKKQKTKIEKIKNCQQMCKKGSNS